MANYERINRATARKLHANGGEFIAIPCKMNPANEYWAMGAVMDKNILPDFDKACNQLEYYNCSSATGYYLSFYIVT